MQKHLKILLGVTIIIAIVEALLFFNVLTPIRSCSTTKQPFDKTFAGCGFTYGQGLLKGYIAAFTVKDVKNKDGNTFVTVNFPVFTNIITLPATFNAGKVLTGKDLLSPLATQVAICQIKGWNFESGHLCRFVKAQELSSVIKPGGVIAAHFILDESLFLKDPYFQGCMKPHKAFLGGLYKRKTIFSYLPYFAKLTCAPSIGQIFYR